MVNEEVSQWNIIIISSNFSPPQPDYFNIILKNANGYTEDVTFTTQDNIKCNIKT
jgi:hypothetical protein